MTKRTDFSLKTLFCTTSCTLLKVARKWCTQCENDKTCLISLLKRCFVQTRALCGKKLKSVAPSAKMTKRADLGLKTLFLQTRVLTKNRLKVLLPVRKWGNVLISGWKRCYGQTDALRWKSLKSGPPSAKMLKRADLGLITLFFSLDKLVHFAEKS